MTGKKRPNPEAMNAIIDRYFQWLIKRDAKKMRKGHFVGKRPARATQA